jgi:hypothetical protein
MKVHCFTSISFNYLAKARTLAHTLRRLHPDWTLTLCVTDREPTGFRFDLSKEAFDHVLFAEDLSIPNVRSWLFQHDVVEACTAVKGPVLKLLTDSDADVVVYLDPDVAVFGSLEPLIKLLRSSSILLTPHQLTPESEFEAVVDNELCSLAFGTYNLGFLAVRNDKNGKRLASWWDERLRRYCYDDRASGIFVDQKWCDLVPAMFDGVKIVRDPGYNVASWNLSNRRISIDSEGAAQVNGSPLRFFHFTKLGPIGDAMTRKYAKDNIEVYELWAWYKRLVDRFSDPRIPSGYWHFGVFENGSPIPRAARLIYREREHLKTTFPDPFAVGEGSYYEWLIAEGRLSEVLPATAPV